MTEPINLVSVFKDGDKFPVDEDTKRRIELVDRAAVRRVLDRIEGERRYWDPRDAHRNLDDLISEMREELDRGDANG